MQQELFSEYIEAFQNAIAQANARFKKKLLKNLFDRLDISVRGHFTDYFYTNQSSNEKIKRFKSTLWRLICVNQLGE